MNDMNDNEQMHERMHERTNERINELMNLCRNNLHSEITGKFHKQLQELQQAAVKPPQGILL